MEQLAAQYKKFKKIANLVSYEDDFKLHAKCQVVFIPLLKKSTEFKLIMLVQVPLYSQTEIIQIILMQKLTF